MTRWYPVPLGYGAWLKSRNMPVPPLVLPCRILPMRVKVNRQYRDPQKFGELGPRSLRMRRVFDPWKHVFSRCYHWKFCRTRSKGWCVITKILQKSLPLRYPAFKVTQGHWKIGFHTTSYWCSILIMGLSRTVSDIKSDIRKIFSPRVFTASRRGFPFEFRNGGGVQKKIRMMPLSDRQKLWRYFRLFRHSIGGTGRRDGQTDGRNWQEYWTQTSTIMF